MDFRLLVPLDQISETGLSSRAQSQRLILNIEGRQWTLSQTLDLDGDDIPEFACISYRWGVERERHALYADQQMSMRTLPSLAAVMRLHKHRAFWTDIFCVPSEAEDENDGELSGARRQATLESMGYIYSRAAKVFVVLQRETFSVLEEMILLQPVSESKLQILENDDWVASVWTYQEVVNASEVDFLSETTMAVIKDEENEQPSGPNDDDDDDADANQQSNVSRDNDHHPALIDCSTFFNALGFSLMKYQQRTALDPFATSRRFPNLHILENVLADWQTANYTYRAAFSILGNISYKQNPDPANYFYASLGALTHAPEQLRWSQDRSGKNLAHKWMDICEGKLDFSYIYSVAEREDHPKKRWRPVANPEPEQDKMVPAILRPVFAWHSWGEAQTGEYDHDDDDDDGGSGGNGSLWLHHMVIIESFNTIRDRETMNTAAKTAIATWLRRPELSELSEQALADATFGSIRTAGYEGDHCSSPLVIEHGFIYPFRKVKPDLIKKVILSTEIRYPMVSPGLVDFVDHEGQQRYMPCIFIGSCRHLLVDGVSVKL